VKVLAPPDPLNRDDPKSVDPLSPSEWRLMRCIWEHGPSTPSQVAEYLGLGLHPKSAGILLARLVSKGFLEFRRAHIPVPGRPLQKSPLRGRPTHVYSALVTFEDSLRAQLQSFLEAHEVDAESCRGVLAEFLTEPSQRTTLKKSG